MGNLVNIAAVQYKLKVEDYRSRVTFQNRINSIMEDIKSRVDSSIPLMVVFPEDIGTPILLYNSYEIMNKKYSFADALQSLISSNLAPVLKYKLRFGISFIRALVLSQSIRMEKEYKAAFSIAAKKYNAYIVAGSITLPDIKLKANKPHVSKRNVYNISYFFDPDGNVIGKQKKVHLVDFENKSGFDLSEGSLDEIKVFNTPFGNVGIAICLDGFREDVLDKLYKNEADILVQPSANNGEWSKWQQEDWLKGAYNSVHNKKLFKYAINPMMNGNIFGLNFEGQSSIISRDNTENKINFQSLDPINGFIQIAKSHNEEEVLISTIEI
jgi:predicted amidohydrolase